MNTRISQEEFINRCKCTHGDRYDLSKIVFTNILNKIIVGCKIHGDFKIRANTFARGGGCKKCGSISASKVRRHSFADVVSKARAIWGDQFDYSEMNFVGMRHPCKIKCNVCGEYFYQKMDKHINAKQNGCKNCSSCDIWSRTNWINYCNSKNRAEPQVYIVRLFNEYESFIKIGITSTTVFNRLRDLPYKYEVIKQIIGDPEFVYNKEVELHRKFKQFKYNPKIEFGGYTECFSTEILDLI